MSLLRRIAALLILSGAGIVLLAPLAARSAVEVAPPAVEHLLGGAPPRPGDTPRGPLAVRVTAAAPAADESLELLEASPLPTPGSAPMEATLVTVPAPAPAPAPAPVRPVAAPSGSVWDLLAECESGGNWAINTGNGYYGGLQFSLGTWQDYGGGEFAAYPHQATREQQIAVAERLRAVRGYAPWPACRAELGLP